MHKVLIIHPTSSRLCVFFVSSASVFLVAFWMVFFIFDAILFPHQLLKRAIYALPTPEFSAMSTFVNLRMSKGCLVIIARTDTKGGRKPVSALGHFIVDLVFYL